MQEQIQPHLKFRRVQIGQAEAFHQPGHILRVGTGGGQAQFVRVQKAQQGAGVFQQAIVRRQQAGSRGRRGGHHRQTAFDGRFGRLGQPGQHVRRDVNDGLGLLPGSLVAPAQQTVIVEHLGHALRVKPGGLPFQLGRAHLADAAKLPDKLGLPHLAGGLHQGVQGILGLGMEVHGLLIGHQDRGRLGELGGEQVHGLMAAFGPVQKGPPHFGQDLEQDIGIVGEHLGGGRHGREFRFGCGRMAPLLSARQNFVILTA